MNTPHNHIPCFIFTNPIDYQALRVRFSSRHPWKKSQKKKRIEARRVGKFPKRRR